MKFVNETQTLEKLKENDKDENFDLKSCIEKISNEELIERLNNVKEVESYTEIDIFFEEIKREKYLPANWHELTRMILKQWGNS